MPSARVRKVCGSPLSEWNNRKRPADKIAADEWNMNKENDYCYMTATTSKMRKTEEGRHILFPPSSSLPSTTSNAAAARRDTSKNKPTLSLVSCFSFRKMKVAAAGTKPKGKKMASNSLQAASMTSHSSKHSSTAGSSLDRPYATIYPTAKMAMDDYVSALYTRPPARTPQHEYENIDEVMRELGLGYAPPLARAEDSISLSSRQYSPSLNNDPNLALNDRIRDFDGEEDTGNGEEGNSQSTAKHSQATASQRTSSHLNRTLSPHPAPNVSFISQASSLCQPDQLSTASLQQAGRGGPLLHSTFNYPLHSTVVTEDALDAEDSMAAVNESLSPSRATESHQYCPFLRRGAQRWPSRAAIVNTAAAHTSTTTPAMLRGVSSTTGQHQRPTQCQNIWLNNMRSNFPVTDSNDRVHGSVSVRSVASQSSARCNTAASSVSDPPSQYLAGRVHKTVNRYQPKQSLSSQTSSTLQSLYSQQKTGTSTSHQQSCHQHTSAANTQHPTSSRCNPAFINTPAKLLQPAHSESSSLQSALHRQTVLLSQINQCLAPQLHRRHLQQPSLLHSSLASASTFCSVTHIDDDLLVLDDTGSHKKEDDRADVMGDKMDESSGHLPLVREQTASDDAFSVQARGNQGARISDVQREQQVIDDYESCADEFSHRLTLLAQKGPLVRTSTQRHQGAHTPRPLSAVSQCSTCCDGQHADKLWLPRYPYSEHVKLLHSRGDVVGKAVEMSERERRAEMRHNKRRQQLPTSKQQLPVISTQRVLLGYC